MEEISIQLLFLFIGQVFWLMTFYLYISIQLLFLFIKIHRASLCYSRHISIQLLFLFILILKFVKILLKNFNTTLVFIYLYCSEMYLSLLPFQYNSCFYLSKIAMAPIPRLSDFNTTLVFIYETRNYGFMRSMGPFRQISDKLPTSNGVLRLLSTLFLLTKIARLPAGPYIPFLNFSIHSGNVPSFTCSSASLLIFVAYSKSLE